MLQKRIARQFTDKSHGWNRIAYYSKNCLGIFISLYQKRTTEIQKKIYIEDYTSN